MDRSARFIWRVSFGLICSWLFSLNTPAAFAQGDAVRAVPEPLVYIDPDVVQEPEDAQAHAPMVVLVDKHRQLVSLYGYQGHWRNLGQWPCSTGKADGPKEEEGDYKTPEGIYFAVRDVPGRYLSSTYGTRALPLDYPNWFDRLRNLSGSAIWLHGTNKPLKPRDSNGCVVLDNESIAQLARSIRLRQTPVIIVDRVRLCSEKLQKKEARVILEAVQQWHRALMYGDYHSFSHWYAAGRQPTMRWWQRWCRQKRKYGRGEFISSMVRRTIFRLDRVYVMRFDQVLRKGSRQLRIGSRLVYMTREQEKVRLLGAIYQPGPDGATDPLFLAWRKLWRPADERHASAEAPSNGQGG